VIAKPHLPIFTCEKILAGRRCHAQKIGMILGHGQIIASCFSLRKEERQQGVKSETISALLNADMLVSVAEAVSSVRNKIEIELCSLCSQVRCSYSPSYVYPAQHAVKQQPGRGRQAPLNVLYSSDARFALPFTSTLSHSPNPPRITYLVHVALMSLRQKRARL
jgi:hypothetical protein